MEGVYTEQNQPSRIVKNKALEFELILDMKKFSIGSVFLLNGSYIHYTNSN